MAGYAPFPQVLVHNLQQVVITDLHRTGQYSSYAVQEMLLELLRDGDLNAEDGFFNDGFLVEGIAGSYDVKVRKGWGFQYDATGLSDKQSAYRVLHLPADLVLSTGGSPPGAGTYYVHVKYASADGQSENRQVRAIPGAAFSTSAVNTAHLPAADVTWDSSTPKAGYLRIATVVVPGAPADSVAYTYTDSRNSLTEALRTDSINLAAGRSYAGEWTYPAGFPQNVQVGSTDIIEFDIPLVASRKWKTSPISSVLVYAYTTLPGDDLVLDVLRYRPGVGAASILAAPVVLGGAAAAAWIELPITGAHVNGDRVYLQATAQVAAGPGDVGIYSAYSERSSRY